VAQICIRYVIQRNALPLPKSITPSRIKENADVDFEISPEDMEYLTASRTQWNRETKTILTLT